MDLVLEFCDAYLLDRVYSLLLPVSLASKISPELQKTFALSNSTFVDSLLGDPAIRSASSKIGEFSFKNVLNEFGEKSHVYGQFPVWFPSSYYTTASILPRTNLLRQSISLLLISVLFGYLLYFTIATFSYVFIFDKAIFNHPRYLKNQMSLEIHQATSAIPVMAFLTIPWFLLELQGYSFLYWDVSSVKGGYWSIFLQYPSFIMFTDLCIYLVHRWLHWPRVYKALHKPHHKWLVTTPYASHAFHPVDGYFQSLPYHIYPFLFPLHKLSYLILFTFVNFWTVMIHDGEYIANDPYINGAACHTVHHLYFNYNYGQFTTLWDRIGDSYREPDKELFDKSKKKCTKTWEDQVKKMEEIKLVVEGEDDDRVYGTEEKFKTVN